MIRYCPSPIKNPTIADRHVSIKDMLENENYHPQPGHCIQIRVVWSSGIQELSTCKVCNFILADDTGCISAFIFINDGDVNAKNVCHKLRANKAYRIKNFSVKVKAGLEAEKNSFEIYQLIRGQNIRILLKNSTAFITDIPLEEELVRELPQHLPFDFTKLEDIDKLPLSSVTDVIGYVEVIDEKISEKGYKYKLVNLCSSHKAKDAFCKPIALFDKHIHSLKKKKAVFAILNVKVGEFKFNRSVSTTGNTVIKEIKRNEIRTHLPPKYHNSDFIMELFPRPRQSGRHSLPQPSDHPQSFLETGTSSANSISSRQANEMLADLPIPGPSRLCYNPSTIGECTPSKKRRISISSADSVVSNGNLNNVNDESSNGHSSHVRNGAHAANAASPLEAVKDEPDDSLDALELNVNKDVHKYNIKDTVKPLKVIVTPSTSFMDTGSDAYSMRSSKPRGLGLIIHNSYFPNKPLQKVRKGGAHDVSYLVNFLKACDFEVTTQFNVTSHTLKQVILDFKKKFENKQVDALFMAVLSHGAYGKVEMVDGEYVNALDDIVYQFDEKNFPEMKGKPKILLINTCQSFDKSANPCKRIFETPSRNSGALNNMIVCFPTSPGSPSLRDNFVGSHFIYVLVSVFMENAHNTDFVSMMHMVHQALKNVVYEGEGEEIMSCTWNDFGFHKKLYFNPRLQSQNDAN